MAYAMNHSSIDRALRQAKETPCLKSFADIHSLKVSTGLSIKRLLVVSCLVLFLLLPDHHLAQAADAFLVATMPQARSGPALVWTGSSAYILGGTDGLTNLDTILEFEPSTGVVAPAPGNLPIGVHEFPAVWDGTTAYGFAGKRFQVPDCPGCESVTAIQSYSPTAQPPVSIVAQMPSLRHGASAVWDGRYAFIFGGITGTSGSHLDEIVRFDPATLSVLTMPARLSHPRSLAPAVWTPNGVYIFGGYRLCPGADGSCDDIDKYDPATDTVTLLATKLPQRLIAASAVWSGRFIYIFGGSVTDQILRFDPTDESITVLPDRLPAPHSGGAAFWDGQSAYIVGGSTPIGPSNEIWRYVPEETQPAVLPPGIRTCTGDMISNNPTIVLTHGLQNEDIKDKPEELWTGEGDSQATKLIRDFLGDDASNVNIVQCIWEEAFQPFTAIGMPSGEAYKKAQRNVIDVGVRIARELLGGLGSSYNKPIHFIGHSLGTAVNAYAARVFLTEAVGVEKAQFTALDRPHHLKIAITGFNEVDELLYGYDSDFFASVLQISRPNLGLRIDNYYSLEGAGVGDKANGPVYNHRELINPNDLDDTIFSDEGIDNNHSGVQQWYRWTMAPDVLFDPIIDYRICHSVSGELLNLPIGFDESLNPCKQGWYWSLNSEPDLFPKNNGDPLILSSTSTLDIIKFTEYGCSVQTAMSTITCVEHSSPYAVLQVDIPNGTDLLTFEYKFESIGDGDYAAVLIDNIPIWVLSSSSIIREGEYFDSGPIPIKNLNGMRSMTIVLFGVGEPSAEFEIRNLGAVSLNHVPIANAGPDQTLACSNPLNTPVILNGSASQDPDDDPLLFSWTDSFGMVSGVNPTVILPTGISTISLIVNDGQEDSSPDTVDITIKYPTGDLDNDCDIDKNDVNVLLTYRNKPASTCPQCDLDGDSKITALDARKLTLLCTRPGCATQ